MRQFLILCASMLSLVMAAECLDITLEKSQTWSWSHEIDPNQGLSARAELKSGGYATVFISYSGPPTPSDFDEIWLLREGSVTSFFFPGEKQKVFALVQANDETAVTFEGYTKDGKFDGCEFNICKDNEQCVKVSDSQLQCVA